jgi:flagellin
VNLSFQSSGVATTLRHMDASSRRMQDVSMRLASGSRVTSARFDASGLQISERMRVRAEGFELAARNIQDGQSLARVAEDGMSAVIDQLGRIQELSLQAMNGTLSDEDRLTLDAEVQERVSEIARLMQETEFNGIALLQGDSSVTLQVVVTALTGRSAQTKNQATVMHAVSSTMMGRLIQMRSQQASQQSRLDSMLSAAQSSRIPLEAAASRIADADLAEETAAYARESIMQQASVAVLAQAMRAPELALQLLRA